MWARRPPAWRRESTDCRGAAGGEPVAGLVPEFPSRGQRNHFPSHTLTTTNGVKADAIKLYLNCVNVSADLAISGEATNLSVAYAGLAANTVYQARIELEDTLGGARPMSSRLTLSATPTGLGDVKSSNAKITITRAASSSTTRWPRAI